MGHAVIVNISEVGEDLFKTRDPPIVKQLAHQGKEKELTCLTYETKTNLANAATQCCANGGPAFGRGKQGLSLPKTMLMLRCIRMRFGSQWP